ncbi:MAG TPA: ATP-binding protein [Thermoanaerobaculia bacterium]|nr:ATP-binding protein [Thermoanaerobaculia bacterium]
MRRERCFAKALGSLRDVFDFLDAFVGEHGLDGNAAFYLHLVTEEVFTNMVKYNTMSSHDIRIAIDKVADGVALELTDFDVEPFDPGGAAEVDVNAPLERRRPGGLGLHLVRSMTDELAYDYQDRQLKVTAYKRFA